jgi:hypothetical protein
MAGLIRSNAEFLEAAKHQIDLPAGETDLAIIPHGIAIAILKGNAING